MEKKKLYPYVSFKRKGISYIKSKERLKQERDIQKIAQIAKNALKKFPPIHKKQGRKKKIDIPPEQRKFLYEINKLVEETFKEFPHLQMRLETRGRKKKLNGIDRVKLKRLYRKLRKLMKEVSTSRVNIPRNTPCHILLKGFIARQLNVSFETVRRLIYT
ncbi:MAG: hypothetical protein COY75_08770 [Nitrospirae bacterium CG_4_10_14_0_8_um_filter_41_23]|nr:hypothetical protein [Nitrospirota bacterium]OIP58838.1 MAG: hypothetical protein AUK38_07255 [Nitrospirae bacterium CG2_30_41_42]PIQ95117.1 MAG: hypothetical protein COV68_01245 [Nitrospirae bacterium CG11_big_fil_rev_8_21_14_0_20_41_14]PIV41226.1 MAG: hypothetical protein COS27_10425 [Nitrospirae bacterium CG02_land_8_20_14_3_00_41_53]PIW88227.1 MAG: hypothetical protein COZ94_01010 [Nitrospirae bacterium CG_4_8_14_3_um_filter_41_47]PIY86236.1 MAG: hypothetical protein COY75_08770 [Nitros